jgi:hypothetical protein
MMKETNAMKLIQLAVSRLGVKIFRNNVGMGWIGESQRFSRKTPVMCNPGDVLIRNARPLHAGLCEGSSDLIGWTQREVTPDMVGKPVAVFTALEIKRSERARVTSAQLNFISQVRAAGGIAGLASNGQQAESLVTGKDLFS